MDFFFRLLSFESGLPDFLLNYCLLGIGFAKQKGGIHIFALDVPRTVV